MPRSRSRSRSRSSSSSASSSASSSSSESGSKRDRHRHRHSSSSKHKHHHHRHHHSNKHSSHKRPAIRLHKHSPPLENLTFLSWVHERLRLPAAKCSAPELKTLWSKFRHKWNSGRISDDSASSSVAASSSRAAAGAVGGGVMRGPVLPARSSGAFELKQEVEAEARKADSKREYKRQQANLDSLCPKPDAGSLEARREKKAAVSSFARQRDESPEMRERDMLGGDERQQFNRLVAARKREQDIKDRALLERKAAYAAKERETMQLLLQSCGMHHMIPDAVGKP